MTTRIRHYNPSASELPAEWHVIDASGEILGRLATRVAWLLMGKHKPGYVSHLLAGDFVVVTNASAVRVTGDKAEQKLYVRHSQYPGSRKEIPLERMMDRHPERVIEHAVRGMLPRNKLGNRMFSRLKVYAGAEHPHEAQITGTERMRARAIDEAEAPAEQAPKPARRRRTTRASAATAKETPPVEAEAPAEEAPKPARRRRTTRAGAATAKETPPVEAEAPAEETPKPARRRRTTRPRAAAAAEETQPAEAEAPAEEAPKPARRRRATRARAAAAEETPAAEAGAEAEEAPKPARRRRTARRTSSSRAGTDDENTENAGEA